jgi:hypothetical protein
MRSRSVILGIAVLAALALVVTAFLSTSGRDEDRAKTLDVYSAFSPSPAGLKGLYLLLKESGYETRRILDAPGGSDWNEVDALFLFESPKPWTSVEHARAEGWVEGGGTLITSPGAMMTQFSAGTRPLESTILYEPDPPRGCRPDDKEWTVCPDGSRALALSRGVRTLTLGQFGEPYEEKIQGLHCLSHLPKGEEAAYEVALYGSCMPLLSIRPVESGRVVVVHHPALFTNRNLPAADNVKIVLNLLDLLHRTYPSEKGPVVGFEEYRRLIRSEERSLWDVLGPGARLAFYQFLFVFFIAALVFGRRFAPPLSPRDRRIRSSLMQTETLAAIMDKTRSYGLALKLIHRHAQRRWKENALRKTPRRRNLFKAMDDLFMKSHYATGRDGESRDMLRRYLSMLDKLNEGDQDERP